MGMIVFMFFDVVIWIEFVMVQNFLNIMGKIVYVEKEEVIDVVIVIFGSGLVYVWFFMKFMMDVACNMGFFYLEVELLVSQIFWGVIEFFNKIDFICEEWIEKVCFRGGIIEVVLVFYDKNLVCDDIIVGVQVALDWVVELGNG